MFCFIYPCSQIRNRSDLLFDFFEKTINQPATTVHRHPASGYVQGINDLVTPFLAVFASEHFEGPMNEWRVGQLPAETVRCSCLWWL